MACQCDAGAAVRSRPVRTFTAVSFDQVSLSLGGAALPAAAAVVKAAASENQIHVSNLADHLMTTTTISAEGAGSLTIEGNLGFISVEMKIALRVTGGEVAVTLELKQPFALGPETWTFAVTGSQLVSRTRPSTATLMAANFDWSCLLKCGGNVILPILVACLPSLVMGPQAFVQCAIGKLAADAPSIAACVAESCL